MYKCSVFQINFNDLEEMYGMLDFVTICYALHKCRDYLAADDDSARV